MTSIAIAQITNKKPAISSKSTAWYLHAGGIGEFVKTKPRRYSNRA